LSCKGNTFFEKTNFFEKNVATVSSIRKVIAPKMSRVLLIGYNFVEGDVRAHVSSEVKALAVLLYGRSKASYGFIAELLGVTPVSVMRWLKEIAGTLLQPVIDSGLV
jgi:hypothetical protein